MSARAQDLRALFARAREAIDGHLAAPREEPLAAQEAYRRFCADPPLAVPDSAPSAESRSLLSMLLERNRT